MRIQPFACFAGVEISNDARTAQLLTSIGQPGGTYSTDCPCSAYDEGGYDEFNSPWYEPTRPESTDFFGFVATEARLQPVLSRGVAETGRVGSTITPLRARGRVVEVAGLMLARSGEGMEYGMRFLSEALRGSPCNDGGCPGDDLLILPACPEMDSYDADRYFRTLVKVGLVDGPVFTPVISRENLVQQAAFTLVSGMPWLYHPKTRCIDDELIGALYGQPLSCPLTTPEWIGDGTFVIDITNVDTGDVTDIRIEGKISLDGSCPVSGSGTSVMPSFSYTIPVLAPEDRIVIDGARRQVLYYDASSKRAVNGLRYIDFDGPWIWPEVGVCSTMCLSLEAGSGDATATVDTYLREM